MKGHSLGYLSGVIELILQSIISCRKLAARLGLKRVPKHQQRKFHLTSKVEKTLVILYTPTFYRIRNVLSPLGPSQSQFCPY